MAAAITGKMEVPVRCSCSPGIIKPTATAKDPFQAGDRPARVTTGALPVVIPVIPVCCPLPHIPAHIVKPKTVGLLLPHRMCRVARVRGIPCDRINHVISGIFLAFATTAGGILPFSFSWQTALTPGRIRKPSGISNRIVPTDANHGMVVLLGKPRRTPTGSNVLFPNAAIVHIASARSLRLGTISGVINKFFKGSPCHGKHANHKTADAHLVYRHFKMIAIAKDISHLKASGLDRQELASGGAVGIFSTNGGSWKRQRLNNQDQQDNTFQIQASIERNMPPKRLLQPGFSKEASRIQESGSSYIHNLAPLAALIDDLNPEILIGG